MWMWSPPPALTPWRTATHRQAALPDAAVNPISSTKSSASFFHVSSDSAPSSGCNVNEQCHTCAGPRPAEAISCAS